MKIVLKRDLPVDESHGMKANLVLDVVETPAGWDRGLYAVISPVTGELIGVWKHECRLVVREEADDV